MSIPLGKIAEIRKYAIPLYLGLIAVGLAGNYFKFSIVNADFIFGSIFVVLALRFFGPGRGIAAAIIAAYTYFAWNHPYPIITMTTEVAVVGYLINGNVIMTNRSDQKIMASLVRGKGSFESGHLVPSKPLTPFPRSKESRNIANKSVLRWIPELPPNTSNISLWGKSFYVAESTIGNLAEWKLVLEQPVAPF